MATPKKKRIISADTGEQVEAGSRKRKAAAPVGNALGYRLGAAGLWILAIGFEILALLILNGTINWTFMATTVQIIIALALDLGCVIGGSLLWKKANHIKPASKKNKLLFWLWNNMGLIVCAIAFVPFIILALTDKKADKKTRAIAVVAAIIAMLIGGLVSYEWNPISQEEQDAAIEAITDDVYWSPFGKVYHTHEDCSSLNRSDELTYGTVEQAIAAGRTRLCSFCAKKDNITGVTTDGVDTGDEAQEDTSGEEENNDGE